MNLFFRRFFKISLLMLTFCAASMHSYADTMPAQKDNMMQDISVEPMDVDAIEKADQDESSCKGCKKCDCSCNCGQENASDPAASADKVTNEMANELSQDISNDANDNDNN